ncbi:MAG: NADPH-dependent oxidoreductase [Pseudomonas fluorescens]|nr:MAG: NADPH-dependent oxidoreductase [Pseudomonas fluorescens]
MKIAIISGSHRPSGNSPRIARVIEDKLKAAGHSTYLLDLAVTELPFWDEGLWGMEGLSAKWEKLWNPIQSELASADAYVILSPEYHGMVSSKLTNLFLLLGNGPTVAHKPALLVSVSSGVGGAYPIAEMRSFNYKNNRINFIPEHLIIRSAGEMFIEDVKPEHAKSNEIVTERLEWLLKLLADYGTAFQSIRAAGNTTHPQFANGM